MAVQAGLQMDYITVAYASNVIKYYITSRSILRMLTKM